MKSGAAFCVIALVVTVAASSRGQTGHAVSLPQPDNMSTRTGIGTNSQNATGASASATPDPEANSAEHDDTLYRGKTSESANPMIRDEGRLHFKTHPNEKVKEVDSLKSLQSISVDPTFQGSFVTSGVSSIEKIAPKPNENSASQGSADQGDPRFRTKNLKFTPQQDDKAAKSDGDSKSSPAPSPSASPAKKSSGAKD